MTLTFAQEIAVIGAMPGTMLRDADEGLFRAIADALGLMPSLSLIACLTRGFADRGLTLDASAASRVARALATAEEGRPAGLGARLAGQVNPVRMPVTV